MVDYRPDLGLLVIDFLTGTTLENESFAEPGVIDGRADACRRLHEGPRFTGDFDMFRRQATYRATVQEHGYRLFDGVRRPRGRLRAGPPGAGRPAAADVPCNNDLLAGNFVDAGDKMWLIDYEYSGNNDACFELGNTATECDFDDGQVEALVAAYFGGVSRLSWPGSGSSRSCCQYGWSLWGVIQAAPAASTSTSTAGARSGSTRRSGPCGGRSSSACWRM